MASPIDESNLRELSSDAINRPDDVLAQLRAAYACDRVGREADAVVFYDAAWKIEARLPTHERQNFMVGYGSTLKNVGRFEDSERILRRLLEEAPTSGAARVFLALTLHAAGRSSAAVGELLDLVLAHKDRDETLERYERAISFYRRELSGG